MPVRAKEEPRVDPAARDNGYAPNLRAELRGLWLHILKKRAPHVAEWVAGSPHAPLPPGADSTPFLQALSIWFQLMRIVEENAAIRASRLLESTRGPSAVAGSFAQALTVAEIDEDTFAALSEKLSVGPTLTAHPTEAKRVTVLEIHRRIYRDLVRLETDRWTPRERAWILGDIKAEIDLLWMTGELRLERPRPVDEIDWGLQFFRDSIYDAVPMVFAQYRDALESAFGRDLKHTPCLRFHSWIGGDRDGNPNVTNEMTKLALQRGRVAILEVYREKLALAAARLSVSDLILPLPEPARKALLAIVASAPASPRNQNELLRRAVAVHFSPS